ncbi:beta-lactamase/transpeptidase-like protein [Metschnikowia bicuspidata var. bicuspidata NRRL YB-4993]|uniref:Beta-lactamase/transpeptidase-like protein n=1 Tax=Metschnikowia bicuspidata var. bicuspidata NRRL YB-4993 TaxID=869754 RepID=A0A1A0H1R6_9ASCO|nr:beta-lactamase/transpeptidase-like protein [Metschnikowia bicuspidata var. bicuspidata NRRL YB-4993]OBA17974.1 beta-lactamase/transpeptidase-like protein [Metschnikowia bicuspidata var. bicuspidata NRRL YB-4993]
MLKLEDICSKYVTAKDGADVPDINAVIAGYTDRNQTKFLSAKGVKNINTGARASTDDILCFFSCTKPMTAMAVLILWERGRIELDVPAKRYLPVLSRFGVIENDQIDPKTGDLKSVPKLPDTDITIRHLLLHTSGFAYTFTNVDYLKIISKKRLFSPLLQLFSPSNMPLVFEPGSDWIYGHSYDWLGLIVQAVSGKKLSEFLIENVFSRAAMTSCTFKVSEPLNMICLHDKSKGSLKLYEKKLSVPLISEIDMGGQGCFGTVGDYLKFMRIWLNHGISPDTGARILTKKTVEYAVQNHLPAGQATNFPIPFSDQSNGYSLAGCGYSGKEVETGRPVGALYWAGLGNLYFWMDIKNGCAGFWGCQILPYMDSSCIKGFKEFEKAVYLKYVGSQTKL